MIEISTNPDRDIWKKFVNMHPHGNIFQTPEMADVYRRTKNYSPLAYAAIDTDTGEMLAFLQAVVINEMNRLMAPFTSRSIIIGGPLYPDTSRGRDAAARLMEQYSHHCGNKAIYTEIRNLWDTERGLFSADYEYEEHLNYLIDLTSGKEVLWNNLTKARRYGISRSRKSGVTIEEMRQAEEVSIFYRMVKDTYTRARLPLADKTLFDAVYTCLVPKNMAKIYFARHEGEEIGAIAFLLYKDRIYDWYSSSLKEYSKLYPNDLLVWQGLEWGSENHYSVFDFMGAGKPDEKYGVREFKRQFGGTLVNFGRYKKVHSPLKNWIALRGLTVYKKLGCHVRLRH